MLKLMSGILTIALLATGCGSSTWPGTIGGRGSGTREDGDHQRGGKPSGGEYHVTTHRSTRAHRIGSGRASRRGTRTNCGSPVYREFTLPVGTTLPLELKSTIASDVSAVEDTVRATLRNAVTVDGQEVLSAGTEVAGHVTEAERAGRVKGRARIAFRFTSVRHDDERLSLRTDPIVQEADATKGEDATKIGVGAGAGAVIGAVSVARAAPPRAPCLGVQPVPVSSWPRVVRRCASNPGLTFR